MKRMKMDYSKILSHPVISKVNSHHDEFLNQLSLVLIQRIFKDNRDLIDEDSPAYNKFKSLIQALNAQGKTFGLEALGDVLAFGDVSVVLKSLDVIHKRRAR